MFEINCSITHMYILVYNISEDVDFPVPCFLFQVQTEFYLIYIIVLSIINTYSIKLRSYFILLRFFVQAIFLKRLDRFS